MAVIAAAAAFVAGALVSLATSWLLVSRLERLGERLGLSEALLGIVAALAADAPEVTAAVSAMAGHEQRLGAGVVLGSNVFNLAALLGLGAVVAGRIGLHRKVVLLGGTVAMCVATVCLAVVLGVLSPAAGCLAGLTVVALYAVVLGLTARGLARLPLPRSWRAWLASAVAEEGTELESAIRPVPGRWPDAGVAAAALVIVVAASVIMERAAAALGNRFMIPEIVVGGLVLAAVTSLPNAVAAIYLAARGRGAATLSTALNSNTLNVAIGLLVPAVLLGLGPRSGQTILAAGWYIALTAAVVAFAYRDRGIARATGILIIAAYLVFAVSVIGVAYAGPHAARLAILAGLATAVVLGARLLTGRPHHSREKRALLAGWPVTRLWVLGWEASFLVAVIDAALGSRVVLIGLLIVGPCCVVLTGRWMPTALTGLWVIGLAVLLGLPDGIWGTAIHFLWLGAVAIVALSSTMAAAVMQKLAP